MFFSSTTVSESRVRFWQAHVRALATSGLSRRAYCCRHQLSYHALTYWVRKFRQTDNSASIPTLIEVGACPSPLVSEPGSGFRLHLGDGRLLEIASDFDQASLGRLLGVLEQGCWR